MCIYLGDNPYLHYDSAEHIIPAAIGGKRKLRKDYVSREFNNWMSKLEKEFIRDSLVAMAREVEGPGKRGKLGERYETRSKVHVVTQAADPGFFSLGYLQKGVLLEIPHYRLSLETWQYTMSFPKTNDADPVKLMADFQLQCINAQRLKMRVILNKEIPVNEILFGIAERVEENFQCFFVKHPDCCTEWNTEKIKTIGAALRIIPENLGNLSYMPTSKRDVHFRLDYFRVYAKMAFNFLSALKGKEFVMHSCFDPLRKWIADGGENLFAELDTENLHPLEQMGIGLPPSSHFIFMAITDGVLFAKVFLYGSFGVMIRLCDGYSSPFAMSGFICDWKNGKEYLLPVYLRMVLKKGDGSNANA